MRIQLAAFKFGESSFSFFSFFFFFLETNTYKKEGMQF